jgi:hypothetical protein
MQPIETIDKLHRFGLFRSAMTKEKLIETLKKILATDHDLSFLMKLTVTELETLVASIRVRMDRDTPAHERP